MFGGESLGRSQNQVSIVNKIEESKHQPLQASRVSLNSEAVIRKKFSVCLQCRNYLIVEPEYRQV